MNLAVERIEGARLGRDGICDNAADRIDAKGCAVFFSERAYERLTFLALRHERSIGELLAHAVEMHYGDKAVDARLRVVARLARLEASLGDPDVLADELKQAVRELRAGQNPAQKQAKHRPKPAT